MSRPVIGITMGDPSGIGPEIIMRALSHAEVYASCRPLVVGDIGRLRQAGSIVRSSLQLRPVARSDEASFETGTVDVIDVGGTPPDLPFGKVSAAAGEAAYRYIERACRMAVAGEADAI